MADVTTEQQRSIETFLYREARLLEQNRFEDWLRLLADDIRYWMPVREVLEKPADENEQNKSFALYDDDKRSLELRALRLDTGLAHAEAPPSTTQRLITNVLAEPADKGGEFRVSSNFLVYQERRGRHSSTYVGRREDTLRVTNSGFLITSRKIELAQSILPATIAIFF
jgi:dibenzofuran dioxygenase beta subunit